MSTPAFPPGWDSDYDGQSEKWFFVHRASGHRQYNFPKAGDENDGASTGAQLVTTATQLESLSIAPQPPSPAVSRSSTTSTKHHSSATPPHSPQVTARKPIGKQHTHIPESSSSLKHQSPASNQQTGSVAPAQNSQTDPPFPVLPKPEYQGGQCKPGPQLTTNALAYPTKEELQAQHRHSMSSVALQHSQQHDPHQNLQSQHGPNSHAPDQRRQRLYESHRSCPIDQSSQRASISYEEPTIRAQDLGCPLGSSSNVALQYNTQNQQPHFQPPNILETHQPQDFNYVAAGEQSAGQMQTQQAPKQEAFSPTEQQYFQQQQQQQQQQNGQYGYPQGIYIPGKPGLVGRISESSVAKLSKKAVKSTKEYIKGHPGQMIGAAAVGGLLLGAADGSGTGLAEAATAAKMVTSLQNQQQRNQARRTLPNVPSVHPSTAGQLNAQSRPPTVVPNGQYPPQGLTLPPPQMTPHALQQQHQNQRIIQSPENKGPLPITATEPKLPSNQQSIAANQADALRAAQAIIPYPTIILPAPPPGMQYILQYIGYASPPPSQQVPQPPKPLRDFTKSPPQIERNVNVSGRITVANDQSSARGSISKPSAQNHHQNTADAIAQGILSAVGSHHHHTSSSSAPQYVQHSSTGHATHPSTVQTKPSSFIHHSSAAEHQESVSTSVDVHESQTSVQDYNNASSNESYVDISSYGGVSYSNDQTNISTSNVVVENNSYINQESSTTVVQDTTYTDFSTTNIGIVDNYPNQTTNVNVSENTTYVDMTTTTSGVDNTGFYDQEVVVSTVQDNTNVYSSGTNITADNNIYMTQETNNTVFLDPGVSTNGVSMQSETIYAVNNVDGGTSMMATETSVDMTSYDINGGSTIIDSQTSMNMTSYDAGGGGYAVDTSTYTDSGYIDTECVTESVDYSGDGWDDCIAGIF